MILNTKRNIVLLILFFIIQISFVSKAQWSVKPFERKAFIEYKGQLEKLLPKTNEPFLYCIDNKSQVFFHKTGLLFVVKKYNKKKLHLKALFLSESKREALEREVDAEYDYVYMNWQGANQNVDIEVTQKQSTKYTYLMRVANGQNYTESCDGFEKLVYKNIYDGIDIEYVFTEQDGFKYNIIAREGADLSKIKMQYDQKHTMLIDKEGNLKIKTLTGELIDHAPKSYLQSSQKLTNSSFKLNNNVVTFNVFNPTNDALIIDPWTVTPNLGGNSAYDNGVDGAGNLYLYGGNSAGIICEKYALNGTTPLWSLTNGAVGEWTPGYGYYYGDLLVESTGNFYLSEGAVFTGAHTYKFNTNSGLIWTSNADANYNEHWRLAINCITNKVIVSGGGTTEPTNNIAEIDVNTGNLTNIKTMYTTGRDDMSGLCVDETGKSYVHAANNNELCFNDANNNLIGKVSSGYSHAELTAHGGITNGYNMMALGGTSFLFTSDGAVLKKWDRNTMAMLTSISIPGGIANTSSGVLADNCNNLWVGSNLGVYRYDFNLVQKEFQATSSPVFDIAFSATGDIMACGNGFATSLVFDREVCGTITALVTPDPCNPSINTVSITPSGGTPPYTILWQDGNTSAVRTNLAPGKYLVVVKDANCIPTVIKDSVEILGGGIKIETQPPCGGGSNGQIKFWLTQNKDITTFAFSPTSNATQINDSTVLVTGLAAGAYSFSLTSIDLSCSLDTTVTLSNTGQLNTSTTILRKAVCPGQPTGSAKITASGGQPYLGNNTSPYTYSWNSTPVQTDSVLKNVTEGTYVVTVSDSVGCSRTESVTITAGPIPQAAFTSSVVCLGKTTSFTNQSTLSSGAIASWNWSFGGPGILSIPTSTVQNASFIYNSCSGINNATLTVTSDSGCVNSITNVVTIHCLPVSNFTVSNSCTNDATQFTSTTSNGSGTIGAFVYQWNLNPTSSTIQNPSHIYTASGTPTVSLLVTDVNGCKDSITKSITVYSLPIANFSSDTVCFGNVTTLLDNSQGAGNAITNYAWDFNQDGIVDNTTSNPNHVFGSATNNIVSYTVSTNPALNIYCRDTVQKTVQIRPMPQANFSYQQVCVNAQPLSFDGSLSSVASGNISSYDWDFGDGVLSTGLTTTHSYNNAGNYNVTLVIKDNSLTQCSATKTYTVKVYDLPKVNITTSKTCLGDGTILTATTLSNSPVITQWNWDTNSSVNSIETTGQVTTFTYNTTGTQTINLIVVSQDNCIDTLTQTMFVNTLPSPNFNADKQSGCPDLCVVFTDNSTFTTPSNITEWQWNLGDGTLINSSLSSQPPHCYTNTTSNLVNNYTINLTVKTDSGCVASLTKSNYITVYPNPIASYIINPSSATVVEPLISFTNTSKDYTQFYWNYGDSIVFDSTTLQPNHLYNSETAYNYVTALIVQNQYGCRDTTTKLVEIGPGFSFYIPNTFTPNNDKVNDTFTGMGIGITKYEMWIYDRWGNMIFYTNDIYKPWDGKVQGESELIQQDVYIWKVKLKDIFNKNHDYNGHVNVVK